jgi:hypothetical protein
VRSFTPVEAAVAVAIAGSVLAAALPVFVRNLHASRLSEPIEGLGRISARATALAASRATEAAYPLTVALTPAEVPRGARVVDPPGMWDHPTWRELEFGFTVPHSYSFSFDSENGPHLAKFRARAAGDLDGDGLYGTFEVAGQSAEGGQPEVFPMEIHREVD